MNESSAREVLLLQAFESVQPPSPHWNEEDRAWASRLALQQEAPDGAADADDGFLARRARHAVQRLLPREPGLARLLGRGLWRPGRIAWAIGIGALLGLLADSVGSSQRINLLAPPVWGVIAWNLGVYGALIVGALPGRSAATRPPWRVRWTERWMQLGWPAKWASTGSEPIVTALADRPRSGMAAAAGKGGEAAAVLRHFGTAWLRTSAPLVGRRAVMLLHAGAAALGVGLMVGLYARGLVLDFRAGWESTFLSADTVHWLLTQLLGPASRLSGIALPDAAGLAALRIAHGSDSPGAPAAPWIHLYALTLVLTVVLPRSLLACLGAWRARRLAADLPLPLADAYFQRLLRQRMGGQARVQVLPYATSPGPQAVHSLRQVLAEVLGERMHCVFAATTAFGDEDAALPHLPADTTHAIALFDLTATPEPEHHGAFLRALAAGVPPGAATLLWVDEAAFCRRFGSSGRRLEERRAAWGTLAQACGTVAVCVDLTASALASAAAALQSALVRSAVVKSS